MVPVFDYFYLYINICGETSSNDELRCITLYGPEKKFSSGRLMEAIQSNVLIKRTTELLKYSKLIVSN